MNNLKKEEVWLRGPIDTISPYLQPAAHALRQTGEDLNYWLSDFTDNQLWLKPAGRASVAFHLQHITGVLDRMMTYAKDLKLNDTQFEYLKNEGVENSSLSITILLEQYHVKLHEVLNYFKTLDDKILIEERFVGRKKLPSTVIGLLFHAAEHSQRHLGQLLVTCSILKNNSAY